MKIEVTDPPGEYSTYTYSNYAVFCNDPYTVIHFELSHTPVIPSLSGYLKWTKTLKRILKKHPEWLSPLWKEAIRKLPLKNEQV